MFYITFRTNNNRGKLILKIGFTLALASLVTMILIDRHLGSHAEFLNAWSVLERLSGHPPSSGVSVVASYAGPVGEFFVVIAVNLGIGFLIALLLRFLIRLF